MDKKHTEKILNYILHLMCKEFKPLHSLEYKSGLSAGKKKRSETYLLEHCAIDGRIDYRA